MEQPHDPRDDRATVAGDPTASDEDAGLAVQPLFHTRLPAAAWAGIAVGWLALSAAAAWAVAVPVGLFMAWAGLAAGAFILNPLAGMLGLIVLAVAAADWGQAFEVFSGKPYSINQAGLANLVMLGLTFLYILKRRPRPGRVGWAFLAFLAAGLISIPFSVNPTAGLRDWSRIAPLAGIYIVCADLLRGSPRRARLWIGAIAASSVWPAIVAAYQYFTDRGYHNVPWVNRILGTLGHPITYGAFLCIVAALLLFLLREAGSAWKRVGIALGILLTLALLFFTYSRGPALALTGSLLVLALVALRETPAFRGGVAALAVLFILFNVSAGRTDDLRQAEMYRQMTPVAVQPAPSPLPTRAPQGTLTAAGALGPVAENFFMLLVRERYEEALAMLSPETLSRVTTETLRSTRIGIISRMGEIKACAAEGMEERSGRQIVTLRCTGAAASYTAHVLFDGSGKVSGIALPSDAQTGTPAARATPPPQAVQQGPVMYGVNSLSWRLNLWRYALELAAPRPVTGLGLGGFPVYSPRLVGYAVTPHNDVIRAFAEMGVLGLGAYLWLWAALAWNLYALWRRAPGRSQALLAAALVAVAAGYFVNGLSADLLNYPIIGWVFWSLMALPEAFRPGSEKSTV